MTPAISLSYRKAALQQASTVGLVIALYDTLWGNLSRAATAFDNNDIEVRCSELVHGFKVLQQLDTMLDMKSGGPAATNLRRFYTHMRGQMLAAQFKRSPEILRQQARLLIDVRGAWQQVDERNAHGQHTYGNPAPAARLQGAGYAEAGSKESGRQAFSCSG